HRRDVTIERDDIQSRLVAVYSAEVTGGADRSADIAAQFQETDARRDRGSSAPGRSTRGPRGIPGIIRRPGDFIVGLQVAREFREVGLSYQNRARVLQPRDCGR